MRSLKARFSSSMVTHLVPPSLSYIMVRLSKLKINPQILCTYFSWKTRKEEFLKPRGKKRCGLD